MAATAIVLVTVGGHHAEPRGHRLQAYALQVERRRLPRRFVDVGVGEALPMLLNAGDWRTSGKLSSSSCTVEAVLVVLDGGGRRTDSYSARVCPRLLPETMFVWQAALRGVCTQCEAAQRFAGHDSSANFGCGAAKSRV